MISLSRRFSDLHVQYIMYIISCLYLSHPGYWTKINVKASVDSIKSCCLGSHCYTECYFYVKGHPSPAAKVTAPPPATLNNGGTNITQDLLTAEVEINDSPARYEIQELLYT